MKKTDTNASTAVAVVETGPIAEQLTTQYRAVVAATGQMLREAVKFGAMLIELETIVGKSRAGCNSEGDGIKGWLAEHCPEINYNTAKVYKSLAAKSATLIGGMGLQVVAALQGGEKVTKTDGEVIDVPAEIIEKRDALFAECDSRRKLEQAYFAFMSEEGKPKAKKRSKGLDVGDESAPALTAEQEAHAEWSRLFVLKPRFSKMMRLAKCLTFADASDALELLRPLMDSLRARVKEK